MFVNHFRAIFQFSRAPGRIKRDPTTTSPDACKKSGIFSGLCEKSLSIVIKVEISTIISPAYSVKMSTTNAHFFSSVYNS